MTLLLDTPVVDNRPLIEKIEEELLILATGAEAQWVTIAKKLIDIRDEGSFAGAVDERTGKEITSFEGYLQRFSRRVRPVLSSGSVSTLKSWVYKFDIYDGQMAYGEDWLQEMGSHANILLRAANLDAKRILQNEDRPLPNGGLKLGRHQFKVLCDRIYDNVVNQSSAEDAWGVEDTKAEVDKLLGSEPVVLKEWDVSVGSNNLVTVDNLKFVVGDYTYDCGSLKGHFILDHFRQITKGPQHKVSGLPN